MDRERQAEAERRAHDLVDLLEARDAVLHDPRRLLNITN
jgi:hypothetical protein